MSAELLAIRDNLKCGFCENTFIGSDSQAWKVKYEKRTVFCSKECRDSDARRRLCTSIPLRGPCPLCGKHYYSRLEKKFCSQECYIASDQFKEHVHRILALTLTPEARKKSLENRPRVTNLAGRGKSGTVVKCLNCDVEIYQKPSRPRRFHSFRCYREFMANRFDRREQDLTVTIPAGFDGFLEQEELPCLVNGCSWHGRFLSVHVNLAHGITAREFKMLAGFNIGSGIVCKPLAEVLSARLNVGVALLENRYVPQNRRGARREYQSLESREHMAKSRLLAVSFSGPIRTCKGCNQEFQQSTPLGRALYCTPECRDKSYSEALKRTTKVRSRNENGLLVWVHRDLGTA